MARINARDLPPGLVPGAPKRSKYRAVRSEYNGVLYASKAEAEYARTLDDSGHVAWWIGQPKFRLGCPENIYICDFLVVLTLGGIIAVDVKGHRTAKFRRDARLWARYGPCDLHIITSGRAVEIITPGGPK